MLASVFIALAALAALTHADIATCESKYNTALAAAVQSDDNCIALSRFTTCIIDILASMSIGIFFDINIYVSCFSFNKLERSFRCAVCPCRRRPRHCLLSRPRFANPFLNVQIPMLR